MSDIRKAMLETAFKTGYEAGYIDEEGYLLNNIPMGDFNALRKHDLLEQVGDEFKLSIRKHKSNTIFLSTQKPEGEKLTVAEYAGKVEGVIRAYFLNTGHPEETSSNLGDEDTYFAEGLYNSEPLFRIFGEVWEPVVSSSLRNWEDYLEDNFEVLQEDYIKSHPSLQAMAENAWNDVKGQLKDLEYDESVFVQFTPSGSDRPVKVEIVWQY